MASATGTCPLPLSSQDIHRELRKFIEGSNYRNNISSEELAKSALILLRSLPSARHAVLEHLCSVFDEAANTHLLQIEIGPDISNASSMPNIDGVIQDASGVLLTFVKTNPEAWAPIISEWSIDLLGQISSKFADRRAVPHSSSLNELLQLWMTCRATKTLIEIASECFASMISSSPDVCVDALLEASVKYSPHFDWVVAHLGSCFPQTIITRVLMCGLKDFYYHGNTQSDFGSSVEYKVPKIGSVVGILGHLAGHHGHDIRKALLALFQDSLKPSANEMELSTVPYLLHLASMSAMLLQVLTTDFVHTLSPSALNKLAEQFIQQKAHALQDREGLLSLVVHLITKSSEGSYRVLQFLLDTAQREVNKDSMDTEDGITNPVRKTCAVILDKLFADLQKLVHRRCNDPSTEIPVLASLQTNVINLCVRMLEENNEKRLSWLSHLLTYISIHCGETTASDVLSHIIIHSTDIQKLQVFIESKPELESRFPDIVPVTLSKVMSHIQQHQKTPDFGQIVANLVVLVKYEQRSAGMLEGISVSSSLKSHLITISSLLLYPDPSVSMTTAELLTLISIPPKLESSDMLKLTLTLVNYYFLVLRFKDMRHKAQSALLCRTLFTQLAQNHSAQNMLLRFLMEGCLLQEHMSFLGGKVPVSDTASKIERPKASFLEENLRHSVYQMLPQSHSSVFHGGIIGKGLKPLPGKPLLTKSEDIFNRRLFVDSLWSCCQCEQENKRESISSPGPVAMETTKQSYTISQSALQTVSQLLVELVTPDVMYNGIHWPEEKFMEVTVERDLVLSKKIEDNPVLWDILELASFGSQSVCTCSCLYRSIMATLITYWEGCRDKAAVNSPKQLEASCRLIEGMRKGGLLPVPLCYVAELFHELSPYELHLLLLTVWRYMKENPPFPDTDDIKEQRRCDSKYTEDIRSILHSKIHKLGKYYARFFRVQTS